MVKVYLSEPGLWEAARKYPELNEEVRKLADEKHKIQDRVRWATRK